MIKFSELIIDSLDSYKEIKEKIPEELYDEGVIDQLQKNIGTKCDRIVIEYPYYDSDYLSTYYSYYSKKFKKYKRECCRLHLEYGETYYGYITLRPTNGLTKIGKTYLKPSLFVDNDAYLMLCDFHAHVHGQDKSITCFPWKKQQTDISCCAHTAAWTVLRYFGNKYRNYSDTTIGNLVEKVKNSWGRKTPTSGLTPVQISDLFKEYGFSPLIVDNTKEGTDFIEEVLCYVESGIPMVGFITPENHAVSIIGHGCVRYDYLDGNGYKDRREIMSHTCLIDSVYVMDDRYFPYREVSTTLPSQGSDVEYSMSQLRFVVIPLYRGMQLVYKDVHARLFQWIEEKKMKWEKDSIYRIYITTSNSLKRETMKSDTMPQALKEIIMALSFPRFVWCIDLAGVENYKNQLTSGRVIIDTTSASLDSDPWILRHDGELIQYKDYDEEIPTEYNKKCNIAPYRLYTNNLKNGKEGGINDECAR